MFIQSPLHSIQLCSQSRMMALVANQDSDGVTKAVSQRVLALADDDLFQGGHEEIPDSAMEVPRTPQKEACTPMHGCERPY